MKLYNSEVKVLRLDTIPENGDLMFSLVNPEYHRILINGEVEIDYSKIDPSLSHTPTDKAAIGVDKDGMTMLVEVEGHGVTVAQLTNVMVALGAVHAVYTEVAVIKTYELLELEAAQPILNKEKLLAEAEPYLLSNQAPVEEQPKKHKGGRKDGQG